MSSVDWIVVGWDHIGAFCICAIYRLYNHTSVGVHTCAHVPVDAIGWLHTNFKLIIIMNEWAEATPALQHHNGLATDSTELNLLCWDQQSCAFGDVRPGTVATNVQLQWPHALDLIVSGGGGSCMAINIACHMIQIVRRCIWIQHCLWQINYIQQHTGQIIDFWFSNRV